jgi:hypothetical protein
MKTWIKSMITGVLAGLVILGSLPALAGSYDVKISQRAMNHERRIQEGVLAGQVTPGEFQRLELEQAHIRATVAQMWADGHLRHGERVRLNRMLTRSRQNIYNLKHNRWKAAPVY